MGLSLGLVGCLNLMSAKADSIDLPPGLTRWTWTTDVWVDGGYQDNLLLSPDAREASPFARVGADVSLALMPLGSFHFQANVNAEEKRFTEGVSVTHERYVGANVEMAYDLNKFWRASLESHYLFEDQVYDASLSSTNTSSILVRGHATTDTDTSWRL